MKTSQFLSIVLIVSGLSLVGCQTTTPTPIEREFTVSTSSPEHQALNGTKIEVEVAPGGDVECEVKTPDGQEYEQTFNLNAQVPGTRIVYASYLFEFEREGSEIEIDVQRVGQPNTEFWEESLNVSQFLTGAGSNDDGSPDPDD